MQKFHLVSLLLVVTLLLAGCAAPAAQPTTPPTAGALSGQIAIGAVWSLTGGAAVYGPQQKNGSELAMNEINAAGMLGAAAIKLIFEDDRSVKEGAIPAFEKLINNDKVVAILGPTLSNSALAADPIAQSKKVVVMATSNTAGGILEIGDFIFRDSLPEAVVVPNTVKVTSEALKYKKVAVMYGEDDAFTKSGYDVFKQALADLKIETVTTETFKKGDTDFSAQLTKVKTLNPEAIILSALAEEAAGIMVQGRQLGIPATVRFIGGNGLNSAQLAKLAGRPPRVRSRARPGSSGPRRRATRRSSRRTRRSTTTRPTSSRRRRTPACTCWRTPSAMPARRTARRSATPWRRLKDVDTILGQVLGGCQPRGRAHAHRAGSEERASSPSSRWSRTASSPCSNPPASPDMRGSSAHTRHYGIWQAGCPLALVAISAYHALTLAVGGRVEQLPQQIINGLWQGGALALFALGYTLVFGSLDIVNLAHGANYMWGAYVGLLVVTKLGCRSGRPFRWPCWRRADGRAARSAGVQAAAGA